MLGMSLSLEPPSTLNTIIEAGMKKAYVEPKATPTQGSGFKQQTSSNSRYFAKTTQITVAELG